MLKFLRSIIKKNPYTETDDIRSFSKDTDPSLLVWHQDDEDRTVEVLNDALGWSIQDEKTLPALLCKGDKITIEKGMWHRVLRNDECTDLILRVKKHT